MNNLRGAWAAYCSFKRTIMWTLLARQKKWLWSMGVIATLGAINAAIIAFVIKEFIDKAIIDKALPIKGYGDSLVFLAMLGLGFGIAGRQVISRVGYHLEYELRLWMYQRLQAMSPTALDGLATGQVVTRAMTDLSVLEVAILLIPGVVVGVTLLVALAIVLLVVNPLMGAIALSGIPINFLLIRRIQRRLWAMSWRTLDRRAQVTTAIDEPVRGIRVVKAFGREDHERDRVAEAAAAAYRVVLARIRLVARYNLLLSAMPVVLNSVLLYVGGRLLVHGKFTVGTLLIYLIFSQIFTGFASSFDEIASGWQFARTGGNRIFELIALAPADPTATPGAGRPLPAERHGLELRSVGYAPGGAALLTKLSFEVAPGGVTVLTGGPGSGKSLVAAIAAGGVDPTEGTVRLDGVAMAELDPHEVRQQVRVLTEDPFLFGRTVRENLEVGIPRAADGSGAPDETLRAALIAAAADGIVADLPGGLDGLLGDRGYTLSGGQRQRLALARALVRPPRVLILDDALSAVNPSLEIDIVKRIQAHAPDTALLFITRRAGVVSLADAVVELSAPPSPRPRRVGAALEPDATPLAAERDLPVDERLVAAIAELPPETDEPGVTERDATESDSIPTVRHLLTPFISRVAVATVVLIGFTIVSLAPAGLFKLAVDDFVNGSNGRANLIALAVAVIAFVIGGLGYAFRLYSARVTEGIMYLLRRRTFQRLSRLGVDYYDRNLPGQVAARVVHDLDRISGFIETGLYQIAVAFTLLVATMVVLSVWSPPIAAIVGGFLVAGVVATAIQVPLANRAYLAARAKLGDVVERFQEDIAGRYLIDVYGARDNALDAFALRAMALRNARRRSTTISNVYLEVVQLFTYLATAALLTTAGNLVIDNQLSVGSVISLELYLGAALAPIPLLSGVLQSYLAARASFRALSQPYRESILPVEAPDRPACPELDGALRLDDVSFRYPGTERLVLHDVTLDVPAGSAVALVGPTGAGKSSIAKLVARIYDPDAGVVTIDGAPLADYDLTSYRRRLGIVPQDAFCFRGTVAANVAYGRPQATRADVEFAAESVGALEALRGIPGGFDGYVEEEGRNLTAAQRQYIALCRAVLVEPDVLILDEATSSLDEAAERRVLDAVRALGRTTIFVTHRLPVARTADEVVVVNDGRIVERGSHDALLASGSAYSELWAAGPEVAVS